MLVTTSCEDCGTGLARKPARYCDECQILRLAKMISVYTGKKVTVNTVKRATQYSRKTAEEIYLDLGSKLL